MDEEKYIKEFNQGYLISEYSPELANDLSSTIDKESAFYAGHQQYKDDLYESMKPAWLRSPEKDIDTTHDKDQDRDIELDRE